MLLLSRQRVVEVEIGWLNVVHFFSSETTIDEIEYHNTKSTQIKVTIQNNSISI